jgi:type II secretory pathway component PulK
MKKQYYFTTSGQALITILFFVVIAVSLTSAAVVIFVVNSKSTTRFEQSTRAYYIAESGIENALIRLLRDPGYSGETLPVAEGTSVSQITNSGGIYTIRSDGTVGTFKRSIQVSVQFTNGIMAISAWKEI